MADEDKRELPVAVTVNVNGVGAYPPPQPDLHHEELKGLEGGDDDGHYHLTEDEYNYVTAMVDERRELEESGEDRYTLNDEEYNRLMGVIDKMYPSEDEERYALSEEEYNKTSTLLETLYPEESDEPVFPGLTEDEVDAKIADVDHERLTNVQGGAENDHYHITSSDAEKLQKLIAAFFPDGAEEPVIPSGGVTDHEQLSNLLGSYIAPTTNTRGHYHINMEEFGFLETYGSYDKMVELIKSVK